nr:NADH dehydrogenase subunit 1 [Peloridora minuta]
MYYLCFFLLLVVVLVGVSFFTLLERSILGYLQCRSGPNSLGYLGLMQPFSDAIKLFGSDLIYPLVSNFWVYLVCPFVMLFISLVMWLVYPFFFYLGIFSFGLLYFICVSGLNVYGLMASGWASNSIYSMLGGLRAVAQTISYEVNMIIIFMSLVFLIGGFDLISLSLGQSYVWFWFIVGPLGYILITTLFAETNRPPFDFAEGESELVSGYNVEYGGGLFAFIFMAEYSSIMFMSLMINILFFGSNFKSFTFFVNVVLIMYLFVWVRGSFPRYRYDSLMDLAWKCYLPISLNYLYFLCLGIMFYSFPLY